jgi:hypothetical protein
MPLSRIPSVTVILSTSKEWAIERVSLLCTCKLIVRMAKRISDSGNGKDLDREMWWCEIFDCGEAGVR